MSDTKQAEISALKSDTENNTNPLLATESMIRGIVGCVTSAVAASLQLGATIDELVPITNLALTLQEGAVELATYVVANTSAAHEVNQDPATTHSEEQNNG